MFYHHFIASLYHFLELTYRHSAQCQLLFFACFLLRRILLPNGVQMQRNFLDIFLDQKTPWGSRKHLGEARGEHNPPGHAQGVVGPMEPTCTASPPYKFPNIPKTLGVSTKHNSSCHKFQKPQIQSRHHHGGVHHPHWCLSDDACVVCCRPTGLSS